MKTQEKLDILCKLSEDQLRDSIVVPLLESMGFKDITKSHGRTEHGVDLIAYKENEFDVREYTGFQVKARSIHGAASKKGNATEVLIQAQEAFGHSFLDIYDGQTRNIDRFIVMTSGNIRVEAKNSIKDQLVNLGQSKAIQFLDGRKMVGLIDKCMPSLFWEDYHYFNKYFNALKKDFEKIKDISAIGQKEPIPLEKIYVSLKLSGKAERDEMPIETERMIFEVEKKMAADLQKPAERQRVLEPNAALKNYHNLVIVGLPGSGKTTLLRYLALMSCKENLIKQEKTCVPIPITLLEYLESGKDLRRYIDQIFEKYQFPKAKELAEKDLYQGRCRLLLDGFDELVTKENKRKVIVEMRRFMRQYPKCQIVATSRPAGYHEELTGFTKLELMEFDDGQIEGFVQNWFGTTNPERAKLMLGAIKENEHIHALARTPLMIAIIAVIFEEDRQLPQKRAALYDRCVEVLLSKWDVQKRLRNRYSSDKKEFILRKLAFYAHSHNKRVMTEEEVTKEMLKYFPHVRLKKEDAKPFLDEIWQRSYLLRQISMDNYKFLHLSFQEYFTALELKEQEDGISTIIMHLLEPWWEEPILLYAGISKDATSLIQRIKREAPEDIFYSNLVLFGKCVSAADFTDPVLTDRIIGNLWSLYQTTDFPSLKEEAIKVLALINSRNLIGSLINELKSAEGSVRESAAEALGSIRKREGS